MDSSALKRPATLLGIFLASMLLCSPAFTVESSSFGGIGLQVVPVATGELAVLRVVDGGPASDENIRPGDLIIAVGEFPLAGSDFTVVVTEYLWGRPGTSVTLSYLRPGENGTRSATIVRVPMEPQAIDTPGVQTITPQ